MHNSSTPSETFFVVLIVLILLICLALALGFVAKKLFAQQEREAELNSKFKTIFPDGIGNNSYRRLGNSRVRVLQPGTLIRRMGPDEKRAGTDGQATQGDESQLPE